MPSDRRFTIEPEGLPDLAGMMLAMLATLDALRQLGGSGGIQEIDGDRLCDLPKENGLGVTTQMVERVRIDGSWFDRV
ncbi:hypothetical protein EU805_16345 [Salipiger sp. IMCC34102]|uniref:hypothetical protein n=1 Tax=Salipiger sp. IMCC34102 TaxID=2510647 RepID=UPI00101CB1B1|nr:hypothetical protein [Salipiger sp. IMCC34102]RYH00883.1 hypothetical protein EU805_16345 [Salipiger sp. IMCC34102]